MPIFFSFRMRFVVRVARIVRAGAESPERPAGKDSATSGQCQIYPAGKHRPGGRICLLRHGRAFRPARPATVRPAAFGSVRGLRYLCRMKTLLAVLGAFALALGVIGIFVPLLPTTPFSAAGGGLVGPLLPAALRVAAFPPQAGRLYPRFPGETGHSAACQVLSLGLMWASMLYCVFAVVDAWPWAQASLLAVAASITGNILSFATLRR